MLVLKSKSGAELFYQIKKVPAWIKGNNGFTITASILERPYRNGASFNSAERKMNMIKFKVEILIDEDMVIQDDEYEPDDMYEYIKDKFRKYNLNEVETDAPNHIIFTDAGDNRDFGGFWSAIWDLYGLDWFKKYALKFAWYNYVEERVEDILVEGKRLGMQLMNKTRKAINFDLDTDELKKIFGTSNPFKLLEGYYLNAPPEMVHRSTI